MTRHLAETPPAAPEPVTVTVARRVAAGRETDFEDWSGELTRLATGFPGFLGAGMLRPARVGDPWHVIFRFDSPAHLRHWEDSPDRSRWLAQGGHLVESATVQRVSGLETWFALPGRTAPAPPKWKMFLVSGTVFFLLNVTLTYCYGWAVRSWPVPLRVILVSYPVTAIATWLVMPRVTRLLKNWLYARTHRS